MDKIDQHFLFSNPQQRITNYSSGRLFKMAEAPKDPNGINQYPVSQPIKYSNCTQV